jgi:hypothetical protein
VETAYPYFKTVDQWRNSVRHNLSIHKIFSTIPRTDKHPPGKGGIWVIDECEKIHWPSEDKFIKNFPPSHPHHAVCRQTQHERTAELKAKEKAEAEGREWVPRKTKKVRKLREEDPKKLELKPPPPVPRLVAPPQHMATIPPPRPTIRGPMSPPPRPSANLAAAFEFEDDGDFVPFDRIPQPSFPLKKLGPSAMCPTVGADQDDVENVFGSAPKRVRMAQAEPLSPILEQHVASAYLNDDDDDMFITPARERSKAQPASTSYQFSSSTLKTTPALTQTSSSPTSSPMPSTVTRPSGLQQAWSHMDIPTPKLESAFVLRPSIKRNLDDDEPPMHFMPKIDRQPPKTPVTRSSAAAERTPRVGGLRTPLVKTPLTYGSPARAPPSASAHLSTPLWEMSGVLDRMAESPTRTPRNDVPPTSPTHYSLSECGNSPVMKRRKITTAA